MQQPQAIQMQDGVLHIHDVKGPKGTGCVEARLEAMEQEVFRCKAMVECGLNANHLLIVDYTRDLKVDGKSMKDIIFSLNEPINFLHSQIHDLQSQVFEYESRFKGRVEHLLEGELGFGGGLAGPLALAGSLGSRLLFLHGGYLLALVSGIRLVGLTLVVLRPPSCR
ncbi:40S ribosomal protein S5-1 [Hordeum vulgare]|nr:40S ribosomal protein S5-1 [Hordeum vulgare]